MRDSADRGLITPSGDCKSNGIADHFAAAKKRLHAQGRCHLAESRRRRVNVRCVVEYTQTGGGFHWRGLAYVALGVYSGVTATKPAWTGPMWF